MFRRALKPVVTNHRQRREHAARTLLKAFRELFPQRFAELEHLRGVYDTFEREQEEELHYQVWRWTKQNGIACDAVNNAAYEFAEGSEGDTRVTISDSIKAEEGLSAIEAEPLDETLNEFLTRAKQHYHRKRSFLERYGHTRIRKRAHDHFRYLAVHRVGGYTWEEIAQGKALVEDADGKQKPFEFPSRDSEGAAAPVGW